MSALDALLGIDPNEPLDALAGRLVDSDHQLVESLRARRISIGLSVLEVAARMGISEADARTIETRGGDLAGLRRYALSVGVHVEHVVTVVIEEPHEGDVEP
ncbi:helix-turn-helix domain-containing protein [Oerskovia sp. NPDC060338]|uniref:helix-turn-helix domain-containing protein n=1 Tax=Oerskovia sp. NPDC060338 TaxID=3347100 RepID=UPI00365799E0